MPSLELERQTSRASGYSLIAGVDEVGRGALAGPVMAGAVILPPDLDPSAPWLQGIDDSKKLTQLQREQSRQSRFTKTPWPYPSARPPPRRLTSKASSPPPGWQWSGP